MIWIGIGFSAAFGLLLLGLRTAEVHRRGMAELSRRIDDLSDSLAESAEALAALRERIEARDVEVRIEPDPEPTVPVSRLEGRIEALASAIDDIQAAANSPAAIESTAPTLAIVDPREAIEEFLGGMGYEDVAYLGDGSPAELASSGRVSLSARKRGILYKGHAIVEEGRVTAANLQPSHGMFP